MYGPFLQWKQSPLRAIRAWIEFKEIRFITYSILKIYTTFPGATLQTEVLADKGSFCGQVSFP